MKPKIRQSHHLFLVHLGRKVLHKFRRLEDAQDYVRGWMDAQDGEAFTLKPSPSWTKRGTINADKQRQTMLLSGLDCCPGQESLFQTDGENNSG